LVSTAVDLEREINAALRGSKDQTERFNRATTRVTGKPAGDARAVRPTQR
jgi:hypothetical protein